MCCIMIFFGNVRCVGFDFWSKRFIVSIWIGMY